MRAMLLVLIAACGGSPKGTKVPEGSGGTEATKQTECGRVASHVADAVFTWKEPPPTKKENVVLVINERCEADQWSVEAKACFGAISDEDSAKPCAEKLTKDQHEKVMNAMEAKFEHKNPAAMDRAPAAQPPPPPPPGKGGPAKGADPCEGGE